MKVLRTEQPWDREAEAARMKERRQRELSTTGIRKIRGGWQAIKRGRLVAEHYGVGSKAAAIQAAGSNEVVE